ncbi:MAG TPA: EAL domain-containing protein [Solirubrobacteraceae bacterium]|jgi:diguanylate cyclase (GGDEF)-like protein/PAS domain S-box-containing protein|nr:EAL domain-containing protein [Solirubrobacteraceae bacterium]
MSAPSPDRPIGHDRSDWLADAGPAAAGEGSLLPSELEARALVDLLPAIVYVSDTGVEGRWHYISSGAEAILGFSPQEWMADPALWARQVHEQDRDHVFGREENLAEPGTPDEYRMRHRDGHTVWVRDEAALLPDAQGRVRWHGVMLDITDRKLAEAELERSAAQQAAVARLGERALEGAEVTQLMHHALAEAARILGVGVGAVFEHSGDRHTLALRAGLGLPRSFDCDSCPLEQLPDGIARQIDSREGSWGMLWLAMPAEDRWATADADFVQALANILADAIQQRGTEDHIRYQALHDPLTDLPNRTLFLDRLAHALSRPNAQIAVALLDIDNFKLVNDSLGHSAGDELLRKVAPRLTDALRPGDTIARLGGDEFVVLLEQIADEQSAARVAERIVAAFEVPFELTAGEHFAKASLGIAIARSEDEQQPAALIRDADAAMYQAKARGRGRFEVFDGAMRARAVKRLSVENDLRRALERQELRVAYQPIVSLHDGSIAAVEALLRWQHPTRGLLAPGEFIPVAEESGLIESIGRWVLQSACAQAAEWHAVGRSEHPLGIAVNLSARQFTQRDLEKTVLDALASSGIDPGSLCLEITESVLLEEPDGVSETISRIAAHGVRFVLDDFGTGYSSLAYLGRLPIDGLKVDRSFVDTLGTSSRSRAITTAIVRMAQALSIEVIAEGVETEDQLELVRELGCELAQGFYYHRPVAAEALDDLLAAPVPPSARLSAA